MVSVRLFSFEKAKKKIVDYVSKRIEHMKKYFVVFGLMSCIGLSTVNAPSNHASRAAAVVAFHEEPVRVAIFRQWPQASSNIFRQWPQVVSIG